MNSVEEVLTRLAFWVQAGQVHSGMDSIAMEGASSVNVPPWRIGSLKIKMTKQAQESEKEKRARQMPTQIIHNQISDIVQDCFG